jgi:glycosyltransferase involved in cell wall biosynthesis
MRLLLFCDFAPDFINAFLKLLDNVGLQERVLIRKQNYYRLGKISAATRIWKGYGTTIVNLPLEVKGPDEPVGLAIILSMLVYLILATIVGTFEVIWHRLDAILAVNGFPEGVVAVLVGRLTSRKVAILTDGGDIDILLRRPVISSIMLVALRKASVVATQNNAKAGKLLSAGIKAEICTSYGVDTSRFRFIPPERKERASIIYVGRLSTEKSLDLLLKACFGLRQAVTRFKLLLVGDGPLREQLSETASRLKMAEFVQVEGFIPHQKISEYFERSAIFVLPSIREGISSALLEAMSSGCICLVSDIPDNIEIIRDGHNGFIFHLKDEQDLTKQLQRAISQPLQNANVISFNARNIVETQYSVKAVAKSLDRVLSKL